MARRVAPFRSRTDPGDSPGPSRHPWFPGLTDSVPLIMFGGLAVVLGIYLVATHAPPFVGRLPLYAYLLTLGAIAIVGGLAASVVGQDLEGLPGEGEEVGDDLIVVRRSQWEELQEPVVSLEPAPRIGRPTPEVTRSPPSVGVARSATPTPSPHSDWWDEALAILDRDSPSQTVASSPSEVDDVLESLAEIERDTVTLHHARPPRTPAPRPVKAQAPPVPVRRTLEAPTPVVDFLEDAAPSVDTQLDEIDRVLDDLLLRGTPASVAVAASPALCVGCHRHVDGVEPASQCESCNRPMCPACLARSRGSHRSGLCPTCSMLLDGALGESG